MIIPGEPWPEHSCGRLNQENFHNIVKMKCRRCILNRISRREYQIQDAVKAYDDLLKKTDHEREIMTNLLKRVMKEGVQ